MNFSQFMWPIAEIILYHRYLSFKLNFPLQDPANYNTCALVATLSLKKEKKVAGRMTIKGRRSGKMPWRAVSDLRDVGCRPLA